MNQLIRRCLWWIAFACLAISFVFHFFLLELQNLPINTISLAAPQFVFSYGQPYFVQRWNFFAPHPVSYDVRLLVQGEIQNSINKNTSYTSWIDVSSPLISAVAFDRTSPLFLIEIAASNGISGLQKSSISSPQELVEQVNRNPFLQDHQHLKDRVMVVQEVTRLATAVLSKAYPSERFTKVHIAIVKHYYPRFTEMNAKDTTLHDSVDFFPWEPTPAVVSF